MSRSPALVLATLAVALLSAACGASQVDPGQGAQVEPTDGGLYINWGDAMPPSCGRVTTPLGFQPRVADVLVLFDRSASMRRAFGAGDRFGGAAAVLGDLIGAYDDRIRFGFQQFPAKAGCGPEGLPGCCAKGPSVPVAPGQGESVLFAMTAAAPVGGNTPTAQALWAARDYLVANPSDAEGRYVLLATDGQPSCTRDGALAEDVVEGGVRGPGPCADALGAVDALAQVGVQVIVMGVGEGLELPDRGAPSCLEALAERGGFKRPGAMAGADGGFSGRAFFQASDPIELEHALQRIFGAVTRPTCLIRLLSAPPDRERVQLFFDLVEVSRDPMHQDGWDWEMALSGERLIRLHGSACRRLERLEVERLDIVFGCPPCTNPIGCE